MTETTPQILVADDQPDVLHALRLLLRSEGFTVKTAGSPRAVASAVAEQEFDVLLIDLNYTRDTTSGKEGLDLLARLQAVHPGLPVVVMTAYGTIDGAVEAMRRGARDFIVKPWENDRLLATLRTQVELARALRRGDRAEAAYERSAADGRPPLIAGSRAMRPVLDIVDRVAPSDANVLITGEHGTGKEVVARWIHAGSARSRKPLVAVNASGLSHGVFESELFGHVKGAFTDARSDRIGYFEMADGGTLFLDEIGDMPTLLQAKLLRVLQTGEFQRVGSGTTRRADVRIIAATNVDIAAEVRAGRFREDLLYRLNTVRIELPPLRDRRDDVGPLAHHFLKRTAARYGRAIAGFDAEAMQAMLAHPWPGNVRELEHTIERAVLLARGDRLGVDDLALGADSVRTAEPQPIETMELDEAERWLIRKALDRHDGNVSAAAESLGLSRSALYRRMQRFGL